MMIELVSSRNNITGVEGIHGTQDSTQHLIMVQK